MLMVKKTKAIF